MGLGSDVSKRGDTGGSKGGGYDFSSITSKLQGAAVIEPSVYAKRDTEDTKWTPEMVRKADYQRQPVLRTRSTPPDRGAGSMISSSREEQLFDSLSKSSRYASTATRVPLQSAQVPGDYDVVDREIAMLTTLNNELNETIDRMRLEAQEREAQIAVESNAMRSQVESLSHRCQELDKENHVLVQENGHMKIDIKELQLLYREKEESLKLQKSELLDTETYRKIADTLTRENNLLETELNALRKNLTSGESADNKSQKSIKLLLDNIKYLEKEKSEYLGQLDAERTTCEELSQERDDLTNKLKELIRRYKVCDMELRTLQSRVQDEVHEEVAAESNRVYELQEDCDQLREALRAAQQESRIKAVELMQRENDITELREEMAALSKERECELIDSLRGEIFALSEGLRERDVALSRSSSTILEKDALVATERIRVEEMQSLIDRLKAERTEREKELHLQQEESEKKLRKMNSELTAVVSTERLCLQ